MGFKFSLQKILDLKYQEEQQLSVTLELERNNLLESEKVLENLKNQLSKTYSDRQNTPITNGKELILYTNFFEAIRTKIESQEAAVKEQLEVIEKIQIELTQIISEKKTLEKLKEKHYKSYQYQEEKKTEYMLDEIFMHKYSESSTD